ncbi:MAG TPA: L,D-transpeptidase [Longimicrobiaceae bacterium]
MHQKWYALAAVLAALAPAAARAQAAPRDTGLILSTPEAAVAAPVTRLKNFSLTVDISDRTLYLISDGEVVRRFPVSVGQEGYSTPPGTYRIAHMIWNPSWRPPPSPWARDHHFEPPNSPGNPMGRVKMFFREPDLYIHGTYLPSSLGNARSHGCIRMRNVDAVELARIVMVQGGANRDQEWYQETIAKADTSREVALPRPVVLRVRQ